MDSAQIRTAAQGLQISEHSERSVLSVVFRVWSSVWVWSVQESRGSVTEGGGAESTHQAAQQSASQVQCGGRRGRDSRQTKVSQS